MSRELTILYASKKPDIKKRLEEFKQIWWQPDHKIFAELVFCLCTPQSKASVCNSAVKKLEEQNLLLEGDEKQIAEVLSKTGVRFANNKASYIVKARGYFAKDGQIKIKSKINTDDTRGLRNWLAENIPGLGMKESSHFLRNIGFGQDVAILDRHILRSLVDYSVIKEIPTTLTKQKYLEIEQKMIEFSKRTNIALDELDLLFWSEYGSLSIEEMK
jgi:N-glycosylase/DNA lyase